ncbi:MAG: GNAT family N-acetyltransferase [Nitriliruptoraceae bacterium]
MEQLQVRKAEPADATRLARLLGGLGHALGDDDVADRLRWFSRSGSDHVLVALSDAHAVGLLTLSVLPRFTDDGRFARITTLATPPSEDRDWIERALLAEAESVAERHRCTEVEVVTDADGLEPSGGSFQALGYTATDEREVRLHKRLEPPEPVRI